MSKSRSKLLNFNSNSAAQLLKNHEETIKRLESVLTKQGVTGTHIGLVSSYIPYLQSIRDNQDYTPRVSRGDMGDINLLEEIINKYCADDYNLKNALYDFIQEAAFLMQIYIYKSDTGMFAVKFPSEDERELFINALAIYYPEEIDQDDVYKSLRTFKSNGDTLFLAMEDEWVKLSENNLKNRFISYLYLEQNNISVTIADNKFTINDDRIQGKPDKTKNIPLSIPKYIPLVQAYNEKKIGKHKQKQHQSSQTKSNLFSPILDLQKLTVGSPTNVNLKTEKPSSNTP